MISSNFSFIICIVLELNHRGFQILFIFSLLRVRQATITTSGTNSMELLMVSHIKLLPSNGMWIINRTGCFFWGWGDLFSKTSWRGQSRFRSKVCFYLLARKWEVLTKTGNNNCRYDMHNLLVGYFLGQEIETSPGV